MASIYVDFDNGIPRYVCKSCNSCNSLFGLSLCSVKNRGCCWYYPKFNLLDIQRMSKSIDGLLVLDKILKNPGTVIYNYYIHAKGYFDNEGYNAHIDSGNIIEPDRIEDQTIFFRACPFVKEGYGCTISPQFRSLICNFFVCDEILNMDSLKDSIEPYIKERSSYSRWEEWENSGLKSTLNDMGLNLVNNFNEVVTLLQKLPLEEYVFPKLDPIGFEDSFPRGA